MKKVILIVTFLLPLIFNEGALSNQPNVQYYEVEKLNGIEDGWYKATVEYYHYGTGTRSTYTLNVEVEYDKVVTIDFGDGSVHSGYNNSGYTYTGGFLSYRKDYDGNITEATTRVSIYTQAGSTITFDILIN